MDLLLQMIILALVFYCVLTKDLRVPHKKAVTRSIVLAVAAVLIQFIVKRFTIEGLQGDTTQGDTTQGDTNWSSNCSDFTVEAECDPSNCIWNASTSTCTTR